jgi:fucose 4-O-acetylase-like acetyltransferase
MKSDKNHQFTRDIRLDILKTIEILCIILAHSQPPLWIYQVRNFDVPLMVMVSGTLFAYSSNKKNIHFGII